MTGGLGSFAPLSCAVNAFFDRHRPRPHKRTAIHCEGNTSCNQHFAGLRPPTFFSRHGRSAAFVSCEAPAVGIDLGTTFSCVGGTKLHYFMMFIFAIILLIFEIRKNWMKVSRIPSEEYVNIRYSKFARVDRDWRKLIRKIEINFNFSLLNENEWSNGLILNFVTRFNCLSKSPIGCQAHGQKTYKVE